MAERKKKDGAGTGNGQQPAGGAGKSGGGQKAQEAASSGGPETRGRADQLGAILAKGLDLAEAGLSLGLTVINRVGTMAQQQVFETSTGPAGAHDGAAATGGADGTGVHPGTFGSGAAQVTAPDEQRYCIINRLPLTPGGTVRVSFSINNDSMADPKKLDLKVEGFVGETEGSHIDVSGFSVKPARKTIAPMDFEKFVLQGAVPPDTVPDIYQGSIIVRSGEELRIPVRLVVMSP